MGRDRARGRLAAPTTAAGAGRRRTTAWSTKHCLSLALHPATGDLYVGTEPACIFRSTDGGESWVELETLRRLPTRKDWTFPGPPYVAHVRGIGLSASDPEFVFGAVEEGWLVRSRDGGESWVNIKDGTEFDSHTVTVLPDGGTVVSASGHGLYRSANGGETFAQSDAGIAHPYLIDIALHPDRPRVLFTAGAEVPPPGWRRPEGAGAGFYRSEDAGSSWTRLTGGLPDRIGPAPRSIAVDPASPETVFIGLNDGALWGEHGRRRRVSPASPRACRRCSGSRQFRTERGMAGRERRDSFDGIAIFVRVAQSASFTEAARQLGLSSSGVSRAIARLESRLGTRLVDRTTRRLSLTAEGSAYFERCRHILAELEAAEDALAEARGVPRGPLRIQVPRGFGRTVVVPALAGFLSRYPEVTVDITVNDGAIDPSEEGVDASFILGEPATGRYVARRICTIGYAVCAAPGYLEVHGAPAELDDLARHRCLNYLRPRSGRRRDWTLRNRGKEVSLPVASVLNANDIQAVHQAACPGRACLSDGFPDRRRCVGRPIEDRPAGPCAPRRTGFPVLSAEPTPVAAPDRLRRLSRRDAGHSRGMVHRPVGELNY